MSIVSSILNTRSIICQYLARKHRQFFFVRRFVKKIFFMKPESSDEIIIQFAVKNKQLFAHRSKSLNLP